MAAIILFYHLASMVVETAHHGVVMGKRANQIWAPIRLVVAIGLLVPISGGLNSGQYIVIQIAQWGSNLASQTWGVFVKQLAAESYQGVAATAPYARKTVYDTVLMEACMYAYNQNMNAPCPTDGSQTQSIGCSGGNAKTMQAQPPKDLGDGTTKIIYDISPPMLSNLGACGHVLFSPKNKAAAGDATATSAQSVVSNAQAAFQNMQTQARQFCND